ncbi:hypothetical protein RN607_06615 [Demequina capsici]|uniref:Tfp pilus assembly protein PilN n=1 Tax=Demequina capsici TaxID=3075620 RepID=A0AA96FES9_9MICO|nr:hypothetical protein [Demequina sp. PMTSA13]WNM28673.1 hypothetical protein RN607_06615 [Demequina sp. PMTSA13]
MNPVPASVKAPTLPQVNLIPPEVGQRRERARAMRAAIALVIGFLLLLAAGAVGLNMLKASAESDLADAQQKQSDLNTQIAQYQYVADLKTELNDVTQARQFVGATDVVRAKVLGDLMGAMPEGSYLTDAVFGLTTFDSAAGASTDAFARADVGQITFTAITPDLVTANDIQLGLSGYPAFSQVRVTEATNLAVEGAAVEGEPTTGYRITGTIRVTYDVYSERFSDAWFGDDSTPGLADQYTGLLQAAQGMRG